MTDDGAPALQLMDRLVLVLRMDEATTAHLRALHTELSLLCGVDIIDWAPHITIAAYETCPLETLLAWTKECAAVHAAFPLHFSSFAFFPPAPAADRVVLFAAPAANRQLTALYYKVHERLDEHSGDLGWLYSMAYGFPAMHATLHMLPADCAPIAAKFMTERFREVVAQAVALEVHQWPMTLIKRFALEASQVE